MTERPGSPAHVLYMVDGLGLSGKTKAMVDLVVGLDPARFRPTVMCFDTEKSLLFDRLRRASVSVEEIPCPDGLNVKVMARLGALVRRLQPDLVHCYNPRTMLYGGAIAQALGIRATLGSLSAFACLTPDIEYPFLPQKLVSASKRNRLRNRIMSWFMRSIVTVSPSLGRNFCRYNRIDQRRLRVVPYGVDIDRFARVTPQQVAAFRASYDLAPGQIVVGSIGRLVEQKDYPTQLRAFALAAARVPALVMLIVGDGPLRESIEALAAELGIAGRVRFTGHRDDVPVAMRSIEIFVLASKFEPYGVALLEAKAAGVAIVATRVNEIPEILGEISGEISGKTSQVASRNRDNALTGRIVPPASPEAMAEAFVQLANDHDSRRLLGERAARDARHRHSLTAVIDAYQQIYEQALSSAAREVAAPAAF